MIARISNLKKKNMEIIFDTETTGLNSDCEIIDICFIDKHFGNILY